MILVSPETDIDTAPSRTSIGSAIIVGVIDVGLCDCCHGGRDGDMVV